MRIFGLTITRQKQSSPTVPITPWSWGGGWFPLIRESFSGAWQRGLVQRPDNVLAFSAVYACVTLIASDIGKLRIRLVERDAEGIWNETDNPAYSPVLRKPNHYQTRIQFYENWITSKLIHGNTYVLKRRDNRGVVVGLYVLDPTRVKPAVTAEGDVFYQVSYDNLASRAQVDTLTLIPASEIIHDVMVPLYHPLCGVSPITACGLAALQGLRVQQHSSEFFANGARPGGLLTSPEPIPEEKARIMQRVWEESYGGENAGKVAVLGGDLKWQSLSMMTATDAQLIEQLRWTAENVCTAFHVLPYMIGVGNPPTYNNIEALTTQYYTQCIQNKVESIEVLLDEGLGLALDLGTEFDLDDLMRMDTQTRSKVSSDAVGSGNMAPNESRKRFWNLPPVQGGNSPYLQQQNFSLEALAKRDAQPDPFAKTPTPAPTPDASEEERGLDPEAVVALYRKDLAA